MKREDFEELVRLLRGWLDITRDEEDRLQNPDDANDSGEALRASWINTRDELRRWAKAHSPVDVQAASDRAILRVGRLLRDDFGENTSLIPAYDGNAFSTAIEALDFAARLAITQPNEIQVEFTYEGGSSIPGVGSIHDIEERFPYFVKRLTEEISHLQDTSAYETASEEPKKPKGKGKDSIDRVTQDERIQKLLDDGTNDLTIYSSAERFVKAAKQSWPGKPMIRLSTVKKLLRARKNKAKREEKEQ